MPDIINVEILEDGTISYQTDKISGTNHVSADSFLKELEAAIGGKVVITLIPHKEALQHRPGAVHQH
uniref:Uncharacterized protein n=1 Tax=viral metagenome TaxID=1070528 RepID=A0A6M3JN00_9ZZZZ